MSTFKVFQDGGAPIKAWVDGVSLDENARQQLVNTSRLPFIHKHLAVMPDCHWGMGATVGSVVATKGAIVPAAVGVDIGCGMVAVRTNIDASRLPDSLSSIRSSIESAVPHGRTDEGGMNDRGAWKDIPPSVVEQWNGMAKRYDDLCDKHPKIATKNSAGPRHLGTLGTGNHFIELCLDENNHVWIMLHSGSRGIGNRIGSYFIERAKKEMERWFISVPDKDLSYLVEGSDLFNDYWNAVDWAQRYAFANRQVMLDNVIGVLSREIPDFEVIDVAVNCHHNYVSREKHFGESVLVTRKGAVYAGQDALGIIPGSMGTRSYIVRGLGNRESFCSCSHGAGRVMSRGEAKRKISLEEHAKATEGVECRKDEEVLDESPAAYKDIDAVMEAQKDLVVVVHTLKQVLCVKG